MSKESVTKHLIERNSLDVVIDLSRNNITEEEYLRYSKNILENSLDMTELEDNLYKILEQTAKDTRDKVFKLLRETNSKLSMSILFGCLELCEKEINDDDFIYGLENDFFSSESIYIFILKEILSKKMYWKYRKTIHESIIDMYNLKKDLPYSDKYPRLNIYLKNNCKELEK